MLEITDDQIVELLEEWDEARLEIQGGYRSEIRFIPGFVLVATEEEQSSPMLRIMPIEEARKRAKAELELKSRGYVIDENYDDEANPFENFPFDINSLKESGNAQS